MGRSVSTPSRATTVAYQDISDHGMDNYCRECEVDMEDGCCPKCGAKVEYDDHLDYADFECWVEDIKETAKQAWPTLSECDKWVGNEDHAILENDHCYIGVSTYCGLAAIWLLPKSEDLLNTGYADDASRANLAAAWCTQVAPKFDELFGQYRKIGTFSNGEAVYCE